MIRIKLISSLYGISAAFYSAAFLSDSTNLTFAPSITYGLLAGLATGGISYGILKGRVEALKEANTATKEHLNRIDIKLDTFTEALGEIKGILGRREGDKDGL